MSGQQHDVFISHASEDKAEFVEPLAQLLRRKGLRVWYDRFTLKVGDSLNASIQKGLAKSRYGVVVMSKSFLLKKWPMGELNGLFAREMRGERIILPILHGITPDEVIDELPILGDIYSLQSSSGLEKIVDDLIRVIKPSLLALDPALTTFNESSFELLEKLNESTQALVFL